MALATPSAITWPMDQTRVRGRVAALISPSVTTRCNASTARCSSPPSGRKSLSDGLDWILLGATDGAGPLLARDQVPEPEVVKNRMHLDLKLAAGATMDAEVARLEGLGGKSDPARDEWPRQRSYGHA